MSRRTKPVASSLELLLDTICNTFGGVLFLAILICMLLRMTATTVTVTKSQESVTPEEMQALESKLESLIAEIETLQLAQSKQDEIAQKFRRPEQEAALQEIERARAERNRLFQERLQEIVEIQKHRRHALEVLKELDDLSRNLEAVRDNLKREQQELRAADAEGVKLATEADELVKAIKAAQSRTAPLPRQRASSKFPVALVVRFNRLYVWHTYDRGFFRGGLNTDEFVVVEERDNHFITMPKPYAGVPLGGEGTPARIAARLRTFDPSIQALTVVIWGDSFQSFQTLKDTIVGLGFEYRLMPMVDGQGVVDRGGTDSRVQ